MPRSFWREFSDEEMATIRAAALRSDQRLTAMGIAGDERMARLLAAVEAELEARARERRVQ